MSNDKSILTATAKKELRIQNHLNKIKLLEEELNRLTILENPREIEAICHSIIDLKKMLEQASSGS